MAAFVQRLPNSIGYVEYAYVKQNKMTYTLIKNQAGNFVNPDDNTFKAAAAGADGQRVDDVRELTQKVVYFIRPKALPDDATKFVPPGVRFAWGSFIFDGLVDGRVHDAERVAYLAAHIGAVADALAQGVPMAGYMVWSLLDNFEWASGYAKRFGIVHVDYETLARTPKDSYLWYRDFIAAQRP